MSVVHRLTGYDKKTEWLTLEYDVPASKLKHAKELAGVEHDDIDAVGSYPLSVSQAKSLAKLVNQMINVDHYSWFLEPFYENNAGNTAA